MIHLLIEYTEIVLPGILFSMAIVYVLIKTFDRKRGDE